MINSVVSLLKRWREEAIRMETQAEHETGLKRERLLAMAQVLRGCEEDLRAGLQDAFLEYAQIFVDGDPDEAESAEREERFKLQT